MRKNGIIKHFLSSAIIRCQIKGTKNTEFCRRSGDGEPQAWGVQGRLRGGGGLHLGLKQWVGFG